VRNAGGKAPDHGTVSITTDLPNNDLVVTEDEARSRSKVSPYGDLGRSVEIENGRLH